MAKVKIELIYDSDCPNVEVARRNILDALAEGPAHDLIEWDRSDPNTPTYAMAYGSPTVLIRGIDISGAESEADAKSCRVYRDESGELSGAPSPGMIRRAAVDGSQKSRRVFFAGLAGIASTLGTVSIPALTCPACWPAYIALLGAAGIGYFDFTPYLVPGIVLSVTIAMAAISYQSYRTRSLAPFGFGLLGGILVLAGRLWLSSDTIVYVGAALLAAALVPDNLKRFRRSQKGACCENSNQGGQYAGQETR